MKNLLLILSFFFFSTSVYAAEFLVNHPDDRVDVNPGDGVCQTEAGYCSLRAAIEESNRLEGMDSIILQPLFYKITLPGADEDNNQTGDFDIRDSVKIFGQGPDTTQISANKLDRIFHIHPRVDGVQLNDMSLVKGFVPEVEGHFGDSGGAILGHSGSLVINKVVFSGNSSHLLGGAIHFPSGNLLIQHSLFQENRSFFGGAIAANHFFIQSTDFKNNIAEGDGGAIHDQYYDVLVDEIADEDRQREDDSRYSIITESRFIKNKINFNFDLIDNDNFLRNRVFGHGGALNLGKAKVLKSLIAGTEVTNIGSSGGGIICQVNCIIDRNQFLNNNVNHERNGIPSGVGGAILSRGKLALSNSSFSGNEARMGGAVAFTSQTNIKDCHFRNNHAHLRGGALYSPGRRNVFISGNEIVDNTSDELAGGAYLGASGNYIVENNNFENNSSSEKGGGVYLFSFSRDGFDFQNNQIRGNNSNTGGGIQVELGENTSGSILDNQIQENVANISGGGIAIVIDVGAELEIRNNQIISNQAEQFGGGVDASNRSPRFARDFAAGIVNIVSSNIEDNRAINGGGINNRLLSGIINLEPRPSLNILGSSIIRNEARESGGGINSYSEERNNSNYLVVMNSTIAQNVAGHTGGAIASYDYLLVHSSTIVTNEILARGELDYNRGAGIFIQDGNDRQLSDLVFRISRSILYHNRTLEINGRDRFDDNCALHETTGFSYHYNLVDEDVVAPGGCLADSRQVDDIVGIEPQILLLEENLQGIYFHPLSFISAAVDSIPVNECQNGFGTPMPNIVINNREVDQNLRVRPHGNRCDIGSTEQRRIDLDIGRADLDI